LGLDVGDKRIGIALSDPTGILASPLTIIDRIDDKKDIEAILSIFSRYGVEKVIIGLPRSMDGSLGIQAQKVEGFTRRLSSETIIPVEFRDERLTTVSARRLKQEGSNKKSRKKVRDDAMAAAVILQGYLDESRLS
jgi:putative Holliday junction resolvase